jgi:hypothetical protein
VLGVGSVQIERTANNHPQRTFADVNLAAVHANTPWLENYRSQKENPREIRQKTFVIFSFYFSLFFLAKKRSEQHKEAGWTAAKGRPRAKT